MLNFVFMKIWFVELVDFKFVIMIMLRYFQSDIDWYELVVKIDYFQYGVIDFFILYQQG